MKKGEKTIPPTTTTYPLYRLYYSQVLHVRLAWRELNRQLNQKGEGGVRTVKSSFFFFFFFYIFFYGRCSAFYVSFTTVKYTVVEGVAISFFWERNSRQIVTQLWTTKHMASLHTSSRETSTETTLVYVCWRTYTILLLWRLYMTRLFYFKSKSNWEINAATARPAKASTCRWPKKTTKRKTKNKNTLLCFQQVARRHIKETKWSTHKTNGQGAFLPLIRFFRLSFFFLSFKELKSSLFFSKWWRQFTVSTIHTQTHTTQAV